MQEQEQNFNNFQIKVLTDMAVLKEQMANNTQKITEIHLGYKSQWEKLDAHHVEIEEHSKDLIAINTRFKLLSAVIIFFGPLLGGFISALFGKVIFK